MQVRRLVERCGLPNTVVLVVVEDKFELATPAPVATSTASQYRVNLDIPGPSGSNMSSGGGFLRTVATIQYLANVMSDLHSLAALRATKTARQRVFQDL